MYVTEEVETETTDHALKLLQQFISELKELARALILLFLEGYTHPEIGEILGLSATHVSTKMHRIKQKLRQKFPTTKNR